MSLTTFLLLRAPWPSVISVTIVTLIPLRCVDDDTESSALFTMHLIMAPLYSVSQLNLVSRMWLEPQMVSIGTHLALVIAAMRDSSCETLPYGQAGISFFCSFPS